MAIIGALQDGLSGDYSLLLTKAILDGVNILITIIGINLTFNNIIHIRVGNMLLALIVPVVYHIFS